MLKIVISSVIAIGLALLTSHVTGQAVGATYNDAFVHFLCTLCTPYTSEVCCSMLNKCCFSECPERSGLSCALGQDTCHYGRCPSGKRCCPGNLFFCCVDTTAVDNGGDGDDDNDEDNGNDDNDEDNGNDNNEDEGNGNDDEDDDNGNDDNGNGDDEQEEPSSTEANQ